MNGATVVFRCDASPAIGAGHVARCLALAGAFASFGYRIVFAVREPARAFLSALSRHVLEIIDLTGSVESEAGQIAARLPQRSNIMVIDHYDRDAAYEADCRHLANALLVFDDGTGRKHNCDFILDSGRDDPAAYAGLVPAGTRFLTGPEYALLRPEFIAARDLALSRRDGRPVRSILISMGATDPLNVTETVLDILSSLPDDVSVTVVLSSRALNVDAVGARAHGRVRLVTDSEDMAGLMTDADLAIGAAGSTSFERACLGLPALMVRVADNQRDILRLMAERGAAVDCGSADAGLPQRLGAALDGLLSDASSRMSMSKAASDLIDGRGAWRVLASLAGEARVRNGARVRLRLAERDDEAWLLELQRQPSTRRFARHPEVPSQQQHAAWFAGVLKDPARMLMIVDCDGDRAGMVRLDRLDGEGCAFEVSIAISEGWQGRGIGLAALRLSRRLAAADLFATVLPGNSASQALFLAAGYEPEADNRYRSRAA